MAEVVGVDLDATAVRAVGVRHGRHGPVVTGFAEVALPEGAVQTGEIHDAGAVAGALRQAWREGRFRTRRAVLGLANQLAVVRPVELPRLAPADLRAALRYELADLVPFPVPESVVDLHVLTVDGDEPRTTVPLLAVVAHDLRNPLHTIAAAAELLRMPLPQDKHELRVVGIDLVPFALVRAVTDMPSTAGTAGDAADAGEAVVNLAGELISVVVHRHGEPRFARLVVDRSATSAAVTAEIEATLAMIETVRTRTVGGSGVDVQAPPAVRRDPVAEAIRSSLDYFAYQPTAVPVSRVRLTGTAERAEQLRDPLAALLGVPVTVISPLEGRLAPGAVAPTHAGLERFAAAFGLATQPGPGRPGPRLLELLPPAVVRARHRRQLAARIALTASVTAAGLAATSAVVGPDPGTARSELARQTAALATVQADLEPLADTLARLDAAETGERRREAIAAGLVSWGAVLAEITGAAPATVTVLGVEVVPPADGEPTGPGRVVVTAQGTATDIETWRAALAGGWLVTAPSITGDPAAGPVTLTVELAPAAIGSRLEGR